MSSLPQETRKQLQDDLELILARIESIKRKEDPNCRVLDHHYTHPLVDDRKVLPLDHEKGEYHHFKEIGHMVLNILTQGQVPAEFKHRLKGVKAPDYIMHHIDASS